MLTCLLSLLAGQFGSSLLGCLSLCTTLCLSSGTCFLTSHLLGYQTVNLGIQRSILFLLLCDDALNGLLLSLQTLHHILLFFLLAFQ